MIKRSMMDNGQVYMKDIRKEGTGEGTAVCFDQLALCIR